MYEKVLCGQMTMPKTFPKNLIDIIRKLLKIYQNKRLGNGKGGCKAIQKHKWFDSLDWDGLRKRHLPAPFRPEVKNTLDTQNFDSRSNADYEEAEVCTSWTPDFAL